MSINNTSNYILPLRAKEVIASGRQVWWIVSDEVQRCCFAIREAADLTKAEREEECKKSKRAFRPVLVVYHDRWCGFHTGLPTTNRDDKTNKFADALRMAMWTREEWNASGTKPPFDPEADVVFVFKAIDEEIKSQPLTLTLLRDIIQANMCSGLYPTERAIQQGKDAGEAENRGSRTLVLITSCMELHPTALPELKPEVIPLPNQKALRNVALDVFEPMWEAFEATKGERGMPKFDPDGEVMQRIVNAGVGLTLADFEESVALACVRHREHLKPVKKFTANLDAFLDTIEHEKAKAISSIAGLSYIPKEQIVGETPPGYEELMAQLDDYTDENGNVFLKGISLGGPPGVAKTVTAKFIARYLKRIGLLLDVGATKGGVVGESEKNIRRSLQIADAMMAVLILDDVDKGGLNKGRDYGGDGGTTGNMIQAMLTKMSDPECKIVFVFTFNRVPDLPELLRLGRVDIRIYVEEPQNGPTRMAIFQFGMRQYGVTVDDTDRLELLANKACDGMTGAEIIHGIIKPAHLRARKNKSTVLDTEFMESLATRFTPMLKQNKYKEDLKSLREDCEQFTKIGNLPDAPTGHKAPARGQARRTTSV